MYYSSLACRVKINRIHLELSFFFLFAKKIRVDLSFSCLLDNLHERKFKNPFSEKIRINYREVCSLRNLLREQYYLWELDALGKFSKGDNFKLQRRANSFRLE